MTLEIENKLSELLDILENTPDKYDCSHDIIFEVLCYGTSSQKAALELLNDVKATYHEFVVDMCEEHKEEN